MAARAPGRPASWLVLLLRLLIHRHHPPWREAGRAPKVAQRDALPAGRSQRGGRGGAKASAREPPRQGGAAHWWQLGAGGASRYQ
jgi:hypothetical protein